MTNTTVETELLRNEAATDIAKRVNLADADFNWLQERLRKLAHDLAARPEESGPQSQGEPFDVYGHGLPQIFIDAWERREREWREQTAAQPGSGTAGLVTLQCEIVRREGGWAHVKLGGNFAVNDYHFVVPEDALAARAGQSDALRSTLLACKSWNICLTGTGHRWSQDMENLVERALASHATTDGPEGGG